MCDIPDEFPAYDGPRGSYACWSVSSREVSNAVAYNCKPNSRWACESYQVEFVANAIVGSDCDDDGLCKHIVFGTANPIVSRIYDGLCSHFRR